MARMSRASTHHLRLLHTCICGVCGWPLRAALLHCCGTEELEPSHPSIHTYPGFQPYVYIDNISRLFLLDPPTQLSYRRPATRQSAGSHDFFGFDPTVWRVPWWRGLAIPRSGDSSVVLVRIHASMHMRLDKRSEPGYLFLFGSLSRCERRMRRLLPRYSGHDASPSRCARSR